MLTVLLYALAFWLGWALYGAALETPVRYGVYSTRTRDALMFLWLPFAAFALFAWHPL